MVWLLAICLASVVQTMDSAVHRINHYPADNSIGFVYPLDSDLSGGQRYPSFEQLGPDLLSYRSSCYSLRSVTNNLLVEPRAKLTTYGFRSFSFAAPRL